MKTSRNFLKTSFACLLVTAWTGVALGDTIVFDWNDSANGTMGWGPNEYTPSGRYGANTSWGSTAGPDGSGALITTGTMNLTRKWLGSSEYQKPSGPLNVYWASALTFDVRLDPQSGLDSAGGLGAIRLFTQYATTPSRTDNNGYSQVWVFGDGSVNTGYAGGFTPGTWVHASIPASLLGGLGSTTDYWDALNLICIGADETYVGGRSFNTDTTVILDIDNIGFTIVPEPSSMLLGVLGFGLVSIYRKLRRS